jgi:hypothetical protein
MTAWSNLKRTKISPRCGGKSYLIVTLTLVNCERNDQLALINACGELFLVNITFGEGIIQKCTVTDAEIFSFGCEVRAL